MLHTKGMYKHKYTYIFIFIHIYEFDKRKLTTSSTEAKEEETFVFSSFFLYVCMRLCFSNKDRHKQHAGCKTLPFFTSASGNNR